MKRTTVTSGVLYEYRITEEGVEIINAFPPFKPKPRWYVRLWRWIKGD